MSYKGMFVAAVVLAALVSGAAIEAQGKGRGPVLKLGEKLVMSGATEGNGAPSFGPPVDATALVDAAGEKYGYPSLPTVWRFAQGAPKIVFVCWETDGYPGEKAAVKDSVTATWQASSGLRFMGWGACTTRSAGVRIQIADTGPHTKGLGNQLNGVPNGMVLNFTYLNWSQACQQSADFCNRAIAVHEFGHAIGLAHEHNRPDTPGECRMAPQGGNGNILLTSYDPDSVMNYCNVRYANNGKLSPKDIYSVQALYCSPSQPLCRPAF